jgi:hypothetical protein
MPGLILVAKGAADITVGIHVFPRVQHYHVDTMSFRKSEIAQNRSSFASKTAFDLLAPSDDEDEEVEVSEPEEKYQVSPPVVVEP